MNLRSKITLLLALGAGAGCAKNSEEVLRRAQQGAEAHCGCVQQQMKKPWGEIRAADCATTRAAFYEGLEGADHSDPKLDEIFNLGRGCIARLSEMDARATAAK
jgi:hypothetical protein